MAKIICLQQMRTSYVSVVTPEGSRLEPRPYWLTVAAAEDEALLENYKTIFTANGNKIRMVEREKNNG